MNYSNRYHVNICSRPCELALSRWTSNMLSYLVEDKVLDLVFDIDSAAYNTVYYSYSSRMVVDAKMVKNEHLPDSARIGDSDEEDSI
jgi:hypothetical protein